MSLHVFTMDKPPLIGSICQFCLKCGVESVLFHDGKRMYVKNGQGELQYSEPECKAKTDEVVKPAVVSKVAREPTYSALYSKQHIFEHKEIPSGETSVIETCTDCGLQSMRFNYSGQRKYASKNGFKNNYIPCVVKKVLIEPIAEPIVQKRIVPKPIVQKQPENIVAKVVNTQPHIPNGKKHFFNSPPVPEDKKFIVEKCQKCGVIARKYHANKRSYLQTDGHFREGSVPCNEATITEIQKTDPGEIVVGNGRVSSSNHKFGNNPIPDGKKYVDEKCLYCPVVRRRYAHGELRIVYHNPITNQLQRKSIPCTGGIITASSEPEQLVQDDDLSLVDLSVKPAAKMQSVATTANFDKARLQESLIIIKLMYEELVKNDIDSKARQIAGRFLYSQGYKELAKHVENGKNIHFRQSVGSDEHDDEKGYAA